MADDGLPTNGRWQGVDRLPPLDHSLTSQTHIFVLDIDGGPTLAFEAASLDEAREICGDAISGPTSVP